MVTGCVLDGIIGEGRDLQIALSGSRVGTIALNTIEFAFFNRGLSKIDFVRMEVEIFALKLTTWDALVLTLVFNCAFLMHVYVFADAASH